MHRRRRSNKNAQTARFSLLLLEDGELFLDVRNARIRAGGAIYLGPID